MQVAERSWTYFNVLEALLAHLSPGTYKADVGAWTQAAWKLRDKYESKFPGLFRQMHFVSRPPAAPYSKQVSDFFVYQAFGGIKEVRNIAYEKMDISLEAQKEIGSRNKELFAKYDSVLNEMAREIEKDLKLDGSS